jgi:hypothetical protein
MSPSPARRIAAVAFVACGCVVGAWAIACGLPGNGLLQDLWEAGGGDEATAEAADDTGLPTSCPTVDAACLDGIPAGWEPVVVSDAGCPPAFTPATMFVNPRLADGGCACGACQVIGSFTCSGSVVITSGDGCGDQPPLATADAGGCTLTPGAQHVEANPIDAAGTVACFAANDAGAGAIADPITVCYPGCSADFCAASPRCIVAEGDLLCPAGFVRMATAGTGADPGCATCACEAGPAGACGGSVTVYDNPTCDDSGSSATYAVGTCNQFSTTTNFQSLLVQLAPPDASCTLGASPVEGDAGLVGVRTICCQ